MLMIKSLSLERNGFQYAVVVETLVGAGQDSENADEARIGARPKTRPPPKKALHVAFVLASTQNRVLARARRRTMRSGVAKATCSFVLCTVTWLRDENEA